MAGEPIGNYRMGEVGGEMGRERRVGGKGGIKSYIVQLYCEACTTNSFTM